MRARLFAFISVLALAAFSCSSPEEFTFVHMSDTQVGFHDTSKDFIHSDTLMQKAVAAVNALSPDVVVITGDLVDVAGNEVQDEIFMRNLGVLEAPVWYIPGNHDIRGWTQEKHDSYVALRGYDRFSFRLNGCAFIGIDTNCIKDGAEEAETEQLAWLEGELRKARKGRYTFLFVHCPIFREAPDEPEDYFNFDMEKRALYLDLLKKYGVDAVFAGHTHCQYSGEYEGIGFYTAAAVGNCLRHGYPGYDVVKVSPDGIEVTYTATPGVNSPARP